MSNIIDNILFNDFGLNTDDAHRYMAKGSSPFFLNVLKGEDGSWGEITNLKGNRKITYELGASNTYFVLSSCYDPLTRNTYYWIFSQPYDISGSDDYEYDNRLLRFNEDTEVIDTIFYDPKNYFGLDPLKPFKDSFVLGDWLYFNPRESEPKMIHISMALNYTKALKELDGYSIYDSTATYLYGDKVAFFGGIFLANEAVATGENPVTDQDKWDRIDDCYQDASDIEFDSEFRYAFSVIKHIPVYRPVCVYASNPNHYANNVRGKLFRFSHRYKYFDNSYSRYSAFSDITLPQYAENYNGEVPDDLDQYNCIDVKIRLHSAALIKEIDIIFQETGGDWKRAKIINRKDIGILNEVSYTHRFYNTDSAYEAIDDTYFGEPYDSVPKKANSQEIINKNILCFGGCTEGFDNINKNDICVSLTPEIEAIDIPEGLAVGGLRRDLIASGDITSTYTSDYGENEIILTTIDFGVWYPNGLIAGDILKVTLNGIQRTYTILLADVNNLLVFSAAIAAFLQTNYPKIPQGGEIWDYGTGWITVNNYIGETEFIFYAESGSAETSLTKRRGFKTGAWHPFCLYYYDEVMRRWDAQTSKDLPEGEIAWEIEGTTVYIPMLGETSPTPMTTAYKWNVNWEVNHLPPVGAKWWRWGYAGNALCWEFVQYIINEIGDVGVSSATEPINTTWVDISPLQTLTNSDELLWNKYPNSNISAYSWTKGDRVRFITQESADGTLGVIVDGVYDYEILAEDKDTNRIYVQEFDHAAIDVGDNTLIEIYTPIKTDTAKIFWEFGELMPIIEDTNGTLVHGCGSMGVQSQDTTTGDPATGVFEAGDVYHIIRTPSKPIDAVNPQEGYFHESRWYSDFYTSDDWDKGRIGTESNFSERDLNIVRYSDQYLQNTLINGIPTFHGGNYKELNDVYGEIMRIIETGDTLKVYQRKKPSSILIGKTQYYDAEGNVNIQAISDRVLGSITYSRTNYGTEFPESIERNNRYVYGFDIYNGVMWRDSPNGIFPISGRYESTDGGGDYKMETYFKQKAKDLLVSGIAGASVLTGWDERHKNLYVIFKDIITDANNGAIIFHEPSNRWICFTDMDQTLDDGWNQILELDWWILWGFENGIGYFFDEDTRFAMFDFLTTTNNTVFPDRLELILTQFAPAITTSETALPTLRTLRIDAFDAIPYITYILVNGGASYGMGFTALEYGSDNAETATITCVPLSGSICEKPDWVTIVGTTGELLAGSTIVTTEVLSVFPTTENTQGMPSRNGYIYITNILNGSSTNYRDRVGIFVVQDAPIAPPIVPITPTIELDSFDESGLILYAGATASTTSESKTITYSMLLNHPGSVADALFDLYWRATVNGVAHGNGISTGHQTPSGTVGTWVLDVYLNPADVVVVYISAPLLSVSTIVYPSLLELTLTPYAPVTTPSYVLPTANSLTWLSTEGGWADRQTVTIACPPTSCYISTLPPWLSVWDVVGNPLSVGSIIYNGGLINVAPTAVNTAGYLLAYLTFKNSFTSGDEYSIVVTQSAYIAPPGEENIVPTITVYTGDSHMEIIACDTQITTGQLNFTLYPCYLYNHLLTPGVSFTVYWKAYHDGTVQIGGGEFTVLNQINIPKTLTLVTAPDVGDAITIIISSMYF